MPKFRKLPPPVEITVASFTCHCCGENTLTFAPSQRAAERSIKEEGWTKELDGQWRCPECPHQKPSQEVQAA
jgi:rubredoxin